MLRDASGTKKSLIERSWEAARKVRGIERIYVATDDARIAEHVEGFGGKVLMTPANCANGTERCARALDLLDDEPEIVVNLQGDAPLTPHWFVEALIEGLDADAGADMATPVLRCDRAHYDALVADRAAGRVGGTTAVFDADGRALYFSKEVLPYLDPAALDADEPLPVFHHVGVYAYRPATLREYVAWPIGPLETREGLEQLRFLEQGRTITCVPVEARGQSFWELNNPEDVERIEHALNVA